MARGRVDLLGAEDRVRAAAGDTTLTGAKDLWPHAEEHLPRRHRERFARLTPLRRPRHLRGYPWNGRMTGVASLPAHLVLEAPRWAMRTSS
jgi:hypothetical protein